ncbi:MULTISPECIES: HNH endonuclease signature motif containing protein [unclassified Rhodococcus (in: high G+C Gram-positive bacteria)]|uniref:HNH endonuclease signature motif containing protein n=1 Tax=unclassified Rhodococcus (in: high G+C Gram-positive bacteria) TaxID=192944 RepID=UPI00117A1EF7|nr:MULTISPECIES: HNH endonuclease signature motif containing protein [unclassified Rhodococcus (in: high G+C Gram-positive bacteria)]
MSDNRIHSGKWTKLSKKILVRDNYECAVEGCDTPATTVDHVRPSSKYPELFWDEDNLVAMCARHNFSKGAKEAGEHRNTWYNHDWFPSDYIKERMKQ